MRKNKKYQNCYNYISALKDKDQELSFQEKIDYYEMLDNMKNDLIANYGEDVFNCAKMKKAKRDYQAKQDHLFDSIYGFPKLDVIDRKGKYVLCYLFGYNTKDIAIAEKYSYTRNGKPYINWKVLSEYDCSAIDRAKTVFNEYIKSQVQ